LCYKEDIKAKFGILVQLSRVNSKFTTVPKPKPQDYQKMSN